MEPAQPLLPPAPLPPPPPTSTTVHLRRRCPCPCSRPCLISTVVPVLALAALFVFLLWPSKPELNVVSLRLDRVHVASLPSLALDVALGIRLEVGNKNFIALDYRAVAIDVVYRGFELGRVQTAGAGSVPARDVSEVDAEILLDGIQVIVEAFFLIEDYAKGDIPLDTVTTLDARLNFFFFHVPLQGKISCSVDLNPHDQTVIHTSCF